MSEKHGIYSGVVDIARNGVDEVIRLRALNAELEAELHEQARVNGMGGEREARLMALNAELVEALRRCRDMVAHPDNLQFIDAALAKADK